ncbi:hypothetical protein [Xanthomonas phaseoli]|uniref:hypothetical protein n=1 Tax=Xanthomonas phaseoli TaxID=1985254 RepID=UPI0002D978AD|nr:hypothetical protein [Xanthomonas phaseoli]MCC8533970.1 hypothetical protein [Xanthomonas phaseoli]RWU19879.1 hypothetical protein XANMN_05425 [Xanthomonas phaseoli pv. manihotis str. CIO151]UEQ16049.1 hypothetical protein K9838_05110 [Xanthomonas phaseoli pv. manihotis]
MFAEPERYAKRLEASGTELPPPHPSNVLIARKRLDLNSKQHCLSSHDFRPTLALAKALNVTR